MDYEIVRIPYQGRREFGTEGGDGIAIANSIISKYFGGVGGAGGGNNTDNGENRGDNSTSFFAYLDKTSGSFSDVQVAEGVYEHIRVFGFKAMDTAQVLIGNLDNSGATDYCDIELYSNGTQIILPYSGFTMLVSNNGTTYPTIDIHLDNNFPIDTITKGELRIPINVNINGNNLDPYHQVWYANKSWVQSAKLYYTFEIVKGGDSSYVLDLSNEKAQVNCDSAGTMFSASIMTITCQARTTLNGDEVSEARYSLVRPLRFNAQGVDINSVTGEMVFNYSGSSPYFSFDGDTLPIDIKSELDGRLLGMKTMTIYKNKPGADGSPAVSHWINTSVNQVNYNPNTDTYVPTQVSAVTWRQVGYNEPEIDSATTMWYGWDDRYMTEYPAGSLVSVSGRGSSEVLYFGLKNANERFYEMETIPILSSGKDGASGATGASGAPGTNGVDGRSAWYMTLSNDNSSINCDASGNILTGAVRPDPCKVRMYYGDERRTDATYAISANTPYTGITTATSNGQLTITAGQNLNFDGGLLEIIVSGTSSGAQRDVKTMTISKNYAGTDGASGQNAVSYWLIPNYTEIIWDVNSGVCTPELITCEAFKQEGELAPSPNPSEAKIALQKQNRTTGSWTPSTPSTASTNLLPSTGLTIDTAFCQTYRRVRLVLMVGSTQYDLEDIDILKDGLDGTSGEARQGAAIRGPYNYYTLSASTRCWCAGESSSTCSDCDKWIDVIYKDNKYYYCNTTYYGKLTPWNNVKSAWTEGDSFDFVATQVLLASAASINFLSNNELYLRDQNGNITGGAKGGSGTTFWAGAEEPFDAPFRVDVSGNVYAQFGEFAGFVQWKYVPLHPNYFDADHCVINGQTINFYPDRKYANIVSIPVQYAAQYIRNIYLPTPSSAWNGFTYDIIIQPRAAQAQSMSDVWIRVSGNTLDQRRIWSYAFPENRWSEAWHFNQGRITITCIPWAAQYISSNLTDNGLTYAWVILSATGTLKYNVSGQNNTTMVQQISNVYGTSYQDDVPPINNMMTFTGDTPIQSAYTWTTDTNRVMFIKK